MTTPEAISNTYTPLLSFYYARWLGIFACISALFMSLPVLSAKEAEGVIVAVYPESFEMDVKLTGDEAAMRVSAGPGDIRIAQVGKEIRGQLVPQGEGYRLEKIFPNDSVSLARLDVLGRQLISENHRLGRKVFRSVGERAPRFALWKENGELFESESLRGEFYILNFVFTRCTVANMCPASTERMIQLSEKVKEHGWEDVKLVSVTLDPAYDTPGIWTNYAQSKGIDTTIHSLLGGPKEVVEALKKQMGVLAEEDDTLIVKHTMSTALVDPTGKIIYRLPGSLWSPDVFIRQIEKAKAP